MDNQTSQNKFTDPFITAQGQTRASVDLKELQTLWFNTGTRCNLSCDNCYIESSPKNDRLSFLTIQDIRPYLNEIRDNNWITDEVGFTGGEPLLNPHIIVLLNESLSRGFKTLLLTNAYRINRHQDSLVNLKNKYGDLLNVRVSLDHYTQKVHEKERGLGTFIPTLKNIKWLYDQDFNISVAGRTLTNEDPQQSRLGYTELLNKHKVSIDTNHDQKLVIFAEMDLQKDVPEITTQCWSLLNKKPDDMMCSNSRMIVKRKNEEQTKVLACTLLAYDKQFEMGRNLKDSKKTVQLNHKFCAQFCVLGGSSCS